MMITRLRLFCAAALTAASSTLRVWASAASAAHKTASEQANVINLRFMTSCLLAVRFSFRGASALLADGSPSPAESQRLAHAGFGRPIGDEAHERHSRLLRVRRK